MLVTGPSSCSSIIANLAIVALTTVNGVKQPQRWKLESAPIVALGLQKVSGRNMLLVTNTKPINTTVKLSVPCLSVEIVDPSSVSWSAADGVRVEICDRSNSFQLGAFGVAFVHYKVTHVTRLKLDDDEQLEARAQPRATMVSTAIRNTAPSKLELQAMAPWLSALSSNSVPLACDGYPFAFTLNGSASDDLLPSWKFSNTSNETQYQFRWESADGLSATIEVSLPEPGAADWTLRFQNTGSRASFPISDIQSLRASLKAGSVLHTHAGLLHGFEAEPPKSLNLTTPPVVLQSAGGPQA